MSGEHTDYDDHTVVGFPLCGATHTKGFMLCGTLFAPPELDFRAPADHPTRIPSEFAVRILIARGEPCPFSKTLVRCQIGRLASACPCTGATIEIRPRC